MASTQRPALKEKDKNVLSISSMYIDGKQPQPRTMQPQSQQITATSPGLRTASKRSRDEDQNLSVSKKARNGCSPPSQGRSKGSHKVNGIYQDQDVPAASSNDQAQPEPTQEADSRPAQESSQGNESTFSNSTTLVECADEPSAAEALRLRLRYAMFKLRTDQTELPISRLEISVPSPSPKPDLVIRDPPIETMRAYHAASPIHSFSVSSRKRRRSTSTRRRPRQILQPGPEIKTAPIYAPWQSDSRPEYGPISASSQEGHTSAPYFQKHPEPRSEVIEPESDQSSPEPERIESGWVREPTGVAVIDEEPEMQDRAAAEFMLQLGGRA